jgi:hypothetical protein
MHLQVGNTKNKIKINIPHAAFRILKIADLNAVTILILMF